jgi:predicted DsbA family dithiol-disulfide isomerase
MRTKENFLKKGKNLMIVEIWSDIVCPWCYIGRRRFEKALNQFAQRDQVEVIWRSYQLDPNAPRNFAGNVNDLLEQRYGMSRKQAEMTHARVTALAALEGLDYQMERAHPVNSLDAHRLIHLAAQHHLQGEMKERLQKAYFSEGMVISDPEILVQLAVDVGLDGDETRRMLEGSNFTAAVGADFKQAQALGINGVPFFLFDKKYAVSGAQPVEVFVTALKSAWSDSHPVVELAGAG